MVLCFGFLILPQAQNLFHLEPKLKKNSIKAVLDFTVIFTQLWPDRGTVRPVGLRTSNPPFTHSGYFILFLGESQAFCSDLIALTQIFFTSPADYFTQKIKPHYGNGVKYSLYH